MSPELPNEGNQDAAGATQPPVAPPSQAQGQLSPEQIKALLDLPNTVKKELVGLQKGADKQIGQVRAEVKRILELKESGLNEAQIQRELALDAILEQGAPPPRPAGNEPKEQSLDAVAVLQELKLDGNDPEVISAYSTLKGVELENRLYKIRYQRDHKPAPSPADAAAMQGGSAPAQDLMGEFEAASKNVRGNALIELKMAFRKRGLDIS